MTIVHDDNLVGAGEYSVPVDETMTRLIISVTGSVSNVEIINPSGELYILSYLYFLTYIYDCIRSICV